MTAEDTSGRELPAERQLEPRSCPRFEACSCNVCPLDVDWKTRAHRAGEPLCFYLRTAVKADVQPRDGIEGRVLAAARDLVAAIGARFGGIRRRLARAATAPPKNAAIARPQRRSR